MHSSAGIRHNGERRRDRRAIWKSGGVTDEDPRCDCPRVGHQITTERQAAGIMRARAGTYRP